MITFKMAAGYCCIFDIYEGYFETNSADCRLITSALHVFNAAVETDFIWRTKANSTAFLHKPMNRSESKCHQDT